MTMNRGNFKSTTSMLDLFLLMAVGFVSLFVLAFILIQPPTDPAKEIELDEQLLIKLTWEGTHNNDLDMWVMTPDGSIVAFKNKQANGVTLERDDRGFSAEQVNVNGKLTYVYDNTEVVRVKRLEDGDYYISVQYYSAKGCINCTVEDYKVEVYDGNRHRTLAIYTGSIGQAAESPVLKITVKDGSIVKYEDSDKFIALKPGG